MKVSENTSVAMPIKNMIGIIIGVAMGIFAYTEITARLTSLETSRELMNADLLKASEQTTVDKEQFLLLEDLYETIEKHQELLDKNIHNQVDLFLTDINELWKTNKIENINLLCDILCLYFKYKPQQIEIDSNKSFNDKEDIHMRYYILGWYIYQNMK